MFYYNPYSKRQRGTNPFLNKTPYSPGGNYPSYTQPTTQDFIRYRKWNETDRWRLYDPYNPSGNQFMYGFTPRTPSFGGAYTTPVQNYFDWRTPRTYQSSYGSPRVTMGPNMPFRPSPYSQGYQPYYQPSPTYGGGQPPMLNQIKDIFTLAQNIGATPQMIQAYLQARGANPYSINIADFLRWWQNYTALNTPYETIPSITPTGG